MSALKKRMTGLLQRKDSGSTPESVLEQVSDGNEPVSKLIVKFCASGQTSDDTGILVRIPEVALSSPSNAQDATKALRKIMSNPNSVKPFDLYNAVMLVLILARHQDGHLFTSCVDDRFVGTLKMVLRNDRADTLGSRFLLKDMIDEFDLTIQGRMIYSQDPVAQRKAAEEGRVRGIKWKTDPAIQKILDLRNDPKNWLWFMQARKDYGRVQRAHGHTRSNPGAQQPGLGNSGGIPQTLPTVLELSERLKEANTSANILEQTMHSHGGDVPGLFKDELFQEFAARCKFAKESLQRYIDLIDSGDQSQTYDDATIAEIVSTRSRVAAVVTMQDRKQEQYNVYRAQNRSPAGQRPSSFLAPTGAPPARESDASVPTPAQPVKTPASNAAARLENPFDDSHELEKGTNVTQGLPGASSSRPSLAVNTSSYTGNNSVSMQSTQANVDKEERVAPKKYVF